MEERVDEVQADLYEGGPPKEESNVEGRYVIQGDEGHREDVPEYCN